LFMVVKVTSEGVVMEIYVPGNA